MNANIQDIVYDLYPRPTNGADGQPLLYVRPVAKTVHDSNAIDNFCNETRLLPKGAMKQYMESFLEIATTMMQYGDRIETPFGTFIVKLKLDGDYTDPKKVKNQKVSLAGIEFIPSKRFVETLEDKIHFGFVQKQEVYERHPVNDPKELEKILEECLKGGYTTIEYFRWAADLKYSTAKSYLNNLCKGDNPLLRKHKEGPTNHYLWAKKKNSK